MAISPRVNGAASNRGHAEASCTAMRRSAAACLRSFRREPGERVMAETDLILDYAPREQSWGAGVWPSGYAAAKSARIIKLCVLS